MSDVLPDRWHSQDGPVLLALARAAENEGRLLIDDVIRQAPNLAYRDVTNAVDTLKRTGYLDDARFTHDDGGEYTFIKLSERGLREVGLWPTPQTALDRARPHDRRARSDRQRRRGHPDPGAEGPRRTVRCRPADRHQRGHGDDHWPDAGAVMDLSSLKDAAPAIGAAATALVAIVGVLRGPGRLRSRLKADVEITAVMPDGNARNRLLSFLDDQVAQLIEDETEKRRDWPMLVVWIVATVGLAALTLWLLQRGTWWSLVLAAPAGFLWLIFLYGVLETGQKVKRDAKGKRIPSSED